ncbi:hypothetical protein EKH77_14430 [Streptomyces luteoverticillatus]|uniref:Serine/threonine protein kinase n=1 Tax=Streptomyces luteoverticillatus TaxID=66425 RepID=A0A3S9PIW1_STRLT|nr:hypothetical protein [Streptomyces luteoverticillatus]AZQ72255.1 hypothetical protein EKH77_14430 [Streptomyces luteoverticillatus]
MHAPPSRGALFLRRTVAGDWAGAAKAALWPSALLLVLAVAISLPSSDEFDRARLGDWSDRFQVVLALLVQGLGGTLDVELRGGDTLLSTFLRGSGYLSVWPLTVTILWAGAVALGTARLRRATGATGGTPGAAEAAVRVALLCGAAVLVLALCGQQDVENLSVSTSPGLAALFSCALAGAVSGAMLCRDRLVARLGAGVQVVIRAWGTALRALALSVALCALVAFVVLAANQDDVGGWTVVGSLPVLVNLGLMALGVSWGAGVEASSTEHSRHVGGTLGLSEIGELAGGWAQAGAVALGVVCAVILAVLAARRSADRVEQVLSGVFFLAVVWLLSFVSGGDMRMTSGQSSFSGRLRGMEASVGTNAGELLLFGLLWTAGAVLLAGVLGRQGTSGTHGTGASGVGTGVVVMPPVPAQPPAPAQPPTTPPVPAAPPVPAVAPVAPPTVPVAPPVPSEAPTAVVPPPYTAPAPIAAPVAPAPVPPRAGSVRGPIVWAAIGLAAFLVGGAATAGVMLVGRTDGGRQDSARHDGDNRGGRVVVTPSAGPAEPSASSGPSGPTGSPTAPAPDPASNPGATPSVPPGYAMRNDSLGFRLAVPDGWKRGDKGNHQIDYEPGTGGSYLRVGLVPKSPQTAYDHFLELEKTLKEKNDTYQRVALDANTFQGRPGARWEFTWVQRDTGRTMHAVDQAYVNESGTEYAVYFQARDEYWAGSRKVFDTALATWSVIPVDFD